MILEGKGDAEILAATVSLNNRHVDQVAGVGDDIGDLLGVVGKMNKRIRIITVICCSLATPVVEKTKPRIEAAVDESVGNTAGGIVNPNILWPPKVSVVV